MRWYEGGAMPDFSRNRFSASLVATECPTVLAAVLAAGMVPAFRRSTNIEHSGDYNMRAKQDTRVQ
jgi:hypothetical protein